jgi:hypothetical protein|tara:strand:- start:217 stop:606 length:390 start_codon:yes stop_codon:yes gene_type:complete
MKIIIFILSIITLFTSVEVYGQDTIQIPQDELNNFFLSLDTLEQQDSLKLLLINSLELQLKNYKLLSHQDSLLLLYKNQEIKLLNSQINLHLKRLKNIDKWHQKPWIGFVGGVATTLLMVHIIDYSLPK